MSNIWSCNVIISVVCPKHHAVCNFHVIFFQNTTVDVFSKTFICKCLERKRKCKGRGHKLSNDFNKTQAIISKKDYGLELSAKAVQHM